jgi:hypothetical protein
MYKEHSIVHFYCCYFSLTHYTCHALPNAASVASFGLGHRVKRVRLKSRIGPITHVMSVRPQQLGSQRTNIRQSSTGDFYENLSRNSKFG